MDETQELDFDNMSEEELKAQGIDPAQIQSAQFIGKLAQAFTGDFNVVPTWSAEDQSQYNKLVAEFNRSQELQGTGISYRSTVGRTMAEQFENQGMIKGTDFELDAKGEVQFIDVDKDTEGVQWTKTVSDIRTGIEQAQAGATQLNKVQILNDKLRKLRKKYPELDFSFDEIEAGLE